MEVTVIVILRAITAESDSDNEIDSDIDNYNDIVIVIDSYSNIDWNSASNSDSS